MKIAIKTSIRRRRAMLKWGDYYFAKGLADSLGNLGHSVRIDCRPEWDREPDFADIDIVLRGHDRYQANDVRPHILWQIYPGKRRRRAPDRVNEYNAAAHVVFASEKDAADECKEWQITSPVSVLLQAFDSRVMMSSSDDIKQTGVVFVGSNHIKRHGMRPIVEMAINAGMDLRLYGPGWTSTPAARYVVDEFFPNADLAKLYQSAKAVLCDHLPAMREYGYVSNRIFDSLACGTPVISDNVEGLPQDLHSHVWRCQSTADLIKAFDEISSATDQQHATRLEFAKDMVLRHSFDARAKQIENIILNVLSGRKV